jgi:large subunit ribosomal protein L21
VEKIADDLEQGAKITFDEVLLLADKETVKIGEPTVSGAKVEAELIENGRDKKISVIRFRAKSRYFKNKGHRQPFSEVLITKV